MHLSPPRLHRVFSRWAGILRPRKLAEQDSALGCAGGVVACDGGDLGKGFVDALDRELGALPTEGGPAEASPKCPGRHEE